MDNGMQNMTMPPLFLANADSSWPVITGVVVGIFVAATFLALTGIACSWLEKPVAKYFWVVYAIALLGWGGSFLTLNVLHDDAGNTLWSYSILEKKDIKNPSGYMYPDYLGHLPDERSFIPPTFDKNHEFITHGRNATKETQATLDKIHNVLIPSFILYWCWVVIGMFLFIRMVGDGKFERVKPAVTGGLVVSGASMTGGLLMEFTGNIIGGSVGRRMANVGGVLQVIGLVLLVFYVTLAGTIMPFVFMFVVGKWTIGKFKKPSAAPIESDGDPFADKKITDPDTIFAERLRRRREKALNRTNK
jgi:hypothetical protein